MRPSWDRPEAAETGVRFVDGTREAVDVIIWCTGYRVSFPFFDPGFLSAPGNDLPLGQRLVHPDVPALCLQRPQRPLRPGRRRAAARAGQSPARTARGGGQKLPADERH